MQLSIITINYNNLSGLKKTIQSVLAQTSSKFEYIIVDGGSSDGSRELICEYVTKQTSISIKWISEKDDGIYNAMNKGICMAMGEYLQFVNSGDCLVDKDATKKMLAALSSHKEEPDILYGNMLKQLSNGILTDKGFQGKQPTMLDFYTGTLNHSPAYIKRSLFDIYGKYDESLKIVSDWKWYMQAIVFGGVIPVYADIDVTLFDMNGISTVDKDADKAERKAVLRTLLPKSVLADYEQWAIPIDGMKRINRYPIISKMFWFVERVLFKIEKRNLGF